MSTTPPTMSTSPTIAVVTSVAENAFINAITPRIASTTPAAKIQPQRGLSAGLAVAATIAVSLLYLLSVASSVADGAGRFDLLRAVGIAQIERSVADLPLGRVAKRSEELALERVGRLAAGL